MSLALYRKYRPTKLQDILGQETNVQILKNAAKADRFAHAYLFYGPRGTGKTSTARLIAKLLNCEKRRTDAMFRKTGEPCNACRHCKEIDGQRSLDVAEIDAASNRGIDEIRNLKDNIKNLPASADFRVYIIDEVHMLTIPAVNALLKTLEEPPPHSVFVLATTEYEKLPATIVSRAQRFLFRRLPKVKIQQKLREIASEEKIKIDEPALELLASVAEGSLRDAISLLDQISSLEESVDLKAAERVTGRTGQRKVEELAAFLGVSNAKGALAYIGTLNEEGHNLVQVTKDLIHYIRRVVSLATSPNLETVFLNELAEDEIARIKKLGAHLTPAVGIRILKALIKAYGEMRYSPFAIVPLEIAIIEQCGSASKET